MRAEVGHMGGCSAICAQCCAVFFWYVATGYASCLSGGTSMFQKIDHALLTAIPRPMHFLPWGTVILSRAVSQGLIWRHLSRTVEQTAASVLHCAFPTHSGAGYCVRAPGRHSQSTVEQLVASVPQERIFSTHSRAACRLPRRTAYTPVTSCET